ncbi:hypothetical protein [Pseudoxanthomonas mexicana]
MTAFRVFSSTDAGAPALTGQAGSLANVLDAVLVDGYGTGPSAKAAAGWSRTYSATNKRVYRNEIVAGSGYYLRLDDTAAIGNARHVFLRAFQLMTDIDTGTNLVPTTAQATNGSLWQKSTTLDATARAWVIVANDKTFYPFFDCAGNGIANGSPFGAGDLDSDTVGDQHNFFLSGNGLAAYTGSTGDAHGTMYRGTSLSTANGSVGNGTNPNAWVARNYAGDVGATPINNVRDDMYGSPTFFGTGPFAYPDVVNGGVRFNVAHVKEGPNVVRGRLPGVLIPLHNMAFSDGQILSPLPGADGITAYVKSFRSNFISNATGNGQVLFDLTTEF